MPALRSIIGRKQFPPAIGRPTLAEGHDGGQLALFTARAPAVEQRRLPFHGFYRYRGQHFLQGGQFFPFPAAAKDTVMPDARKALGQNVQCKSAYELAGREFEQFLLASFL